MLGQEALHHGCTKRTSCIRDISLPRRSGQSRAWRVVQIRTTRKTSTLAADPARLTVRKTLRAIWFSCRASPRETQRASPSADHPGSAMRAAQPQLLAFLLPLLGSGCAAAACGLSRSMHSLQLFRSAFTHQHPAPPNCLAESGLHPPLAAAPEPVRLTPGARPAAPGGHASRPRGGPCSAATAARPPSSNCQHLRRPALPSIPAIPCHVIVPPHFNSPQNTSLHPTTPAS
jgi:hypothetical protein